MALVRDWSIAQVAEWLTTAGFPHFTARFGENGINGDTLLQLDKPALLVLGLNALDQARVMGSIERLKHLASVPGLLLCFVCILTVRSGLLSDGFANSHFDFCPGFEPCTVAAVCGSALCTFVDIDTSTGASA
jgi:hypothetical protein